MIEFSNRKKERRKTSCYIEKDRRKGERRGRGLKEVERKRRKEFLRHVRAQRGLR